MRTPLLLALLALFSCSSEKIIDMTPQNLKTIVRSPVAVVKYYAPWCKHCRAFAPTFVELQEMFEDVTFAEVDCTRQKDLCSAQKISGYPTLKMYEAGKSSIYKGPRDLASLAEWVSAALEPRAAP